MKNEISESKFNAWRACLAVLLIDSKITPEEKKWFEEKLKIIPFSLEQKNILINDFKNGVELESLLPQITDKVDRAFLVDNFRIIANLDRNFSKIEMEKFKNLEAKILKELNLKDLSEKIQKMENDSYSKSSQSQTQNSKSIFENLISSFIK